MIKMNIRAGVATVAMVIGFAAYLSAGHDWGYHWARSSNPFTLKLGDNVTPAWDARLDEAIADWSASSVLNLTKVAGGTRAKNCRPTSGRIEVCNARYGNTGWLGLAQIWISGGEHITQGTAKVNDTYFDTATYNTYSWRQLVMCQEIAHGFGLAHQDETFDNPNLGSCMDYTSSPAGNEGPNAHDFAELEAIYAHLDSTTTIGSSTVPNTMPPAMGQIDFDTRAQWGRLVRASANGRVHVYELDFGRGNRVVTHVFWADLEGDAR